MAESIWPTIHAERQALADDLDDLSEQQWATRSLCTEWDVHDVLAHLLSAAKMTPPRFATRFAAAGFNFDKFAGKQVAIEGAGGPAVDPCGVPGGFLARDGTARTQGDLARRGVCARRGHPPPARHQAQLPAAVGRARTRVLREEQRDHRWPGPGHRADSQGERHRLLASAPARWSRGPRSRCCWPRPGAKWPWTTSPGRASGHFASVPDAPFARIVLDA